MKIITPYSHHEDSVNIQVIRDTSQILLESGIGESFETMEHNRGHGQWGTPASPGSSSRDTIKYNHTHSFLDFSSQHAVHSHIVLFLFTCTLFYRHQFVYLKSMFKLVICLVCCCSFSYPRCSCCLYHC